MVVVNGTKLVGTMYVRSFLTDFSWFNHKASPYVEEISSNYLKMTIHMIDKRRAAIFTYYDVYEDGIEKEEMVHWGLDAKSNVGKATFYIYYEDWDALYNYLSMLNDEYDMKTVKFEIRDDELIVNDEFIIKLYN